MALGVGALLTAVQAVRPFLSAGGRVTVTGSMAADKPWNEAASLGVQKAGVRNLVHSLDTTLKPDGIRAVSVTVRGSLDREGPFTPDRVAEAIHAAAASGRGQTGGPRSPTRAGRGLAAAWRRGVPVPKQPPGESGNLQDWRPTMATPGGRERGGRASMAKIGLCEDDPAIRRIVLAALQHAGHDAVRGP